MKLAFVVFAASAALVAGCAELVSADCGGDAYQIGRRDGRIGAYEQAERYSARCGPQFDPARYAAGWRDGLADRPRPLW